MPVTCVIAVLVLFGFVLGVTDVTVAVFVSVPTVLGACTVTVKVAEAPTASDGSVAVMLPLLLVIVQLDPAELM